MTFSTLLISTCTIRRYTSGAVDAYGQPVKEWDDHLEPQPCKISYPRGRQLQRSTEVIPIEATLFVEDVDVTEKDTVIVDGIEYEILFVARPQDVIGSHHKELDLRRVVS